MKKPWFIIRGDVLGKLEFLMAMFGIDARAVAVAEKVKKDARLQKILAGGSAA